MVKLVDTLVLGTSALWREGSSPSSDTIEKYQDRKVLGPFQSQRDDEPSGSNIEQTNETAKSTWPSLSER